MPKKFYLKQYYGVEGMTKPAEPQEDQEREFKEVTYIISKIKMPPQDVTMRINKLREKSKVPIYSEIEKLPDFIPLNREIRLGETWFNNGMIFTYAEFPRQIGEKEGQTRAQDNLINAIFILGENQQQLNGLASKLELSIKGLLDS